ncbi:MAG: L-lactate dehydrogenase [bacterium]|nr:L-lactate dehydrogenase [bacterium]
MNSNKFNTQKISISIIGAGNVGSAIAYALTIKNVASEINIIDVDEEKQEGEVMDISDGIAYVETGVVKNGTFHNARNSDVIVVTAGAKQKSGETRLDLAKQNKIIMKSIFKSIGKLKSTAIVIIVSNPVDVLTHYVQKITNLPKNQVLGSGTTLDTSRLRTMLSHKFNVSAQNIHGYVLGEHGNSSFVAWSTVSIGGIPINKMKGFNKQFADQIEIEVREQAYEIIEKKGSTYYGIGLSVANIVKAILFDQKLILPVSALLTNWNGISNVCVGSLAIVGRQGVEGLWPVELNSREKKMLKKSTDLVKSFL